MEALVDSRLRGNDGVPQCPSQCIFIALLLTQLRQRRAITHGQQPSFDINA